VAGSRRAMPSSDCLCRGYPPVESGGAPALFGAKWACQTPTAGCWLVVGQDPEDGDLDPLRPSRAAIAHCFS